MTVFRSFSVSCFLSVLTAALSLLGASTAHAQPSATVCDLYPIALHEDLLEGVEEGEVLTGIPHGSQPGGFGWLRWSGPQGVPDLAASLTAPGTSHTYVNPDDPDDDEIEPGKWVAGRNTVPNANPVRDALDALIDVAIVLPVWDHAQGQAGEVRYRVAAFAEIELLSYHLPGQGSIAVRFLRFVPCGETPSRPPVAEPLSVFTHEDVPVEITLDATDFDDSELTFDLQAFPNHGSLTTAGDDPIEPSSGSLSPSDFPLWFVPDPGFFGFDSFTFIANDGINDSEPATVTIEVNARPTIGWISPADESLFLTPASVELAVDAADPDGEVTEVAFFVNGAWLASVEAEPFVFIWDEAPEGTHSVYAVATDDRGASAATGERSFVVRANSPPEFTSEPLTGINEGEVYTYFVTATDPDLGFGDTLAFSSIDLPGWLSLEDNGDGTATLQGVPEFEIVGETPIHLRVSDSKGLSAEQNFVVVVAPLPRDPPEIVVTTPADFSVPVNTDVSAIQGIVSAFLLQEFTVNGGPVEVDAEGNFAFEFPHEADGEHAVVFAAGDALGQVTVLERTIVRDTIAPVLVLFEPAEGTRTRLSSIDLSGMVDDPAAAVTVNGEPLPVGTDGRFAAWDLPLQEGWNTFTVVAVDRAGNVSDPASAAVERDTIGPVGIELIDPPGFVAADRVTLDGWTEPGATVRVTGGLSDLVATADAEGNFSVEVLIQPNEAASIVFRTFDDLGNVGATLTHTVVSDTIPPVVEIDVPEPGSVSPGVRVAVTGTVADANPPGHVIVNGIETPLFGNGGFGAIVALEEGPERTISVVATDLAGNVTSVDRTIAVVPAAEDTEPPAILVLSPAFDAVVADPEIRLIVLIADESDLAEVTIGGTPVNFDPSGGIIEVDVEVDLDGTVEIVAADVHGNVGSHVHRVSVDGEPPPAPSILFTNPESPVSGETVVLYGETQPLRDFEIRGALLDKVTGRADANGRIAAVVPLRPNAVNSLALVVLGANGLESEPATLEVVQDSVPPAVVSMSPPRGAVAVDAPSAIEIFFSEPMAPAGLDRVELRTDGVPLSVSLELSASGEVLVLTPGEALPPSVPIQVRVPSTVNDLAGNEMGDEWSGSFTVRGTEAPPPPVLDPAPAFVRETTLALTGAACSGQTIAAEGGTSPASATAEADGRFSVSVPLHANALNSLSITATDVYGNVSSPAEAGVVHDDIPPQLVVSNPEHGATGVEAELTIELHFNEPVDLVSAEGIALVTAASDAVPVEIAVEGEIVFLTPLSVLNPAETHEVTIPATVTDLAGNPIGADTIVAFQTGGSLPPPVPIIYTVSAEGVTNLPSIEVTGFSTPGTILLISGGEAPFTYPESGTIDSTALWELTIPLARDQLNTIEIRARDAEGAVSGPAPAIVITQDETPPEVIGISVADGAEGVPVSVTLTVAFSEPVAAAPLEEPVSAIRLLDAGNNIVEGAWLRAPSGDRVSFFPVRHLNHAAAYTLLVNTDVTDLAGNRLADNTVVQFTTSASSSLDIPDAPILDPLESDVVHTESVVISGSAAADSTVHVFGGSFPASAPVDGDGRFSILVPLVEDALNELAAVAEIDGVYGEAATVSVQQLARPTGIRILSPQEGVEYNNLSITVAGILDNATEFESITVGGREAPIIGEYVFQQVVLESEGPQFLTAVGTLLDGSTVEASASFDLYIEPDGVDTKAPVTKIIFPEEGAVFGSPVIETILTVEEGVQLSHVAIDDVAAHRVIGNILFVYAHLEEQGENTITAIATDAAGHEGTDSVTVSLHSREFESPPVVDPVDPLTVDRVVTLTGTAEAGTTVVVDGGLVPVRVDAGEFGEFSADVPLRDNRTNELTVRMVDGAGNVSPAARISIVHDDTAPFVVSTDPFDGQAGVREDVSISITFSEPMNSATAVIGSSVFLHDSAGEPVAAGLSFSADGKTLRVLPSYKLRRSEMITVSLTTGLADRNGWALTEPYAFSFHTAVGRTTVSGVVVDTDLRPLVNVPVGIAGTEIVQRTSTFGTFRLDEVPPGERILFVDGRPDPATGAPPQGDARQFPYMEFALHVREDTDSGLGRPIFMVDTDLATATPLHGLEGETELSFEGARDDLEGLSLLYTAGSARFADGTGRGELTVTRIFAEHIPGRLPDGSIPHFLLRIGPDGLRFTEPVSLRLPNVYDLDEGEEVIVFRFAYGVHQYTELGRAAVGPDGFVETGPMLSESGFVGIVPAEPGLGLASSYLTGRVVDAAGAGIAGVSVNAIAGSTEAITDEEGYYTIALPDVRVFLIQIYATVATDLGNQDGESPVIVFPSELVELGPSGITEVPDITIDTFFLGGSIRYLDEDGLKVPLTGLARRPDGTLAGLNPNTVREVEIFVYRRLDASGESVVYDSEPYLRTTASLDPFDDRYDASYALAFLGSLTDSQSPTSNSQTQIPLPGDVVKVVAFDRRTGYYGESDFRIPAAGEDGSRDFFLNIALRPPLLSLDMNRSFFLDSVRHRASLPHNGIAFTNDEYVEFRTTWITAEAVPLDRPEIGLHGRLRVDSIDLLDDFMFPVRGGEHFRVLEIREAIFPARLLVLQEETDVGIETIAISADGVFAAESLLPIEVSTESYGGVGGNGGSPAFTREAVLHILDLSIENGVAFGRARPGASLRIGDEMLTADADGFFLGIVPGAEAAGGIAVRVGDSVETLFGLVPPPVINEITDEPPGLVPSFGGQDQAVTITGRHFSVAASDNRVHFNGAPAQVLSATDTRLVVRVPREASSGPVTVTVGGKRSNGVHFEFVSVGINNGSFEDGTLRGFTVEGSARVVRNWRAIPATQGLYMARLDTGFDPREGVSSLTSDLFTVPEGMQTLLFDYNFMGTALFRALPEMLEFQIVTASETIVAAGLFPQNVMGSYSVISGYNRGVGFQSASVLVEEFAGTGEQIRIRLLLLGRGPAPSFIPGMSPADANPLDRFKEPGTAVLLDNFRLSAGTETALPRLDPAVLTVSSDGEAVSISAPAGTLPPDSRVFLWSVQHGNFVDADVGSDGGFTISAPFPALASRAGFHIAYATPNTADTGSNRIFSAHLPITAYR